MERSVSARRGMTCRGESGCRAATDGTVQSHAARWLSSITADAAACLVTRVTFFAGRHGDWRRAARWHHWIGAFEYRFRDAWRKPRRNPSTGLATDQSRCHQMRSPRVISPFIPCIRQVAGHPRSSIRHFCRPHSMFSPHRCRHVSFPCRQDVPCRHNASSSEGRFAARLPKNMRVPHPSQTTCPKPGASAC